MCINWYVAYTIVTSTNKHKQIIFYAYDKLVNMNTFCSKYVLQLVRELNFHWYLDTSLRIISVVYSSQLVDWWNVYKTIASIQGPHSTDINYHNRLFNTMAVSKLNLICFVIHNSSPKIGLSTPVYPKNNRIRARRLYIIIH